LYCVLQKNKVVVIGVTYKYLDGSDKSVTEDAKTLCVRLLNIAIPHVCLTRECKIVVTRQSV